MGDAPLHIDLRRLTAAVSLLAGIVEGSDDAILAKDIDGLIVAWNPAAERLFGYTEHEAVGQHINLLIPQERQGEDQAIFDKILTGAQVQHYETKRLAKDGTILDVAITVSPLRDMDGTIIGASKIVRDISAQLQSRTIESQLASIVECSDDAIISKDSTGMITSWNPAAETLFGYTASEAIGKHISMLFPYELKGQERDILSEILAGEKVDHYETRRLTKGGRTVDVSLTVSPLRDANGEIVGASKIVRDISEHKEMEARRRQAESLAQANRELAEADRAKDQFLAMANHELRTPLTSIAGFTDTLLRLDDQIDPAQRREFLEIIQSQSQRLTRLVDDLLTISRVQIDRTGQQLESFDVEEALQQLLREQNQNDVKLTTERDLCVVADRLQFQQMVSNYLDNAVKYGEGPYEICACERGDQVEIEMRDHGSGISDDLLPRLFGRFSRGQREMESGVPGTGLGLAIVRGLARAHGGDAWYEPLAPHGSKFCLRLPARLGCIHCVHAVDAPPREGAAAAGHEHRHAVAKYRIAARCVAIHLPACARTARARRCAAS